MADAAKITGDLMADALRDLLAIWGEIADVFTLSPADSFDWARVFGRISKHINALDVDLSNAEDIVKLNNRLRRGGDRDQ